MKNEAAWKPTKFRFDELGQLHVPAEPGEVSVGSLLVAGLVAQWYRLQLPRHARGSLLELGAGKMPLYGLYRPLVDEVICTDWDGSLHGNQFIDFPCDLSQGVPLPDACVDTIVMSDVLEHLYTPHHTMAEMRRLLSGLPCVTVFVTHDPIEAMAFGDQIAVLENGRATQIGDRDALLRHPRSEVRLLRTRTIGCSYSSTIATTTWCSCLSKSKPRAAVASL